MNIATYPEALLVAHLVGKRLSGWPKMDEVRRLYWFSLIAKLLS